MEDKRMAEAALDQMEAESDKWAIDVNLMASIDHIAHVSRLSQTVPIDQREGMIGRQKSLLDALMRQAFIEGGFRALDIISEAKS